MKLTSEDMLGNGLIDEIIKEPLGGAHVNREEIYKEVKKTIIKDIAELEKMDSEERIKKREQKFIDIGVYNE